MKDLTSILGSAPAPEETYEEETLPEIHFGAPVVDGSQAPPDLRLNAHPMRLPYSDDRVDDPAIRSWMEDRRLGVGASEIAVLFNLSPWQNIQELWEEKVHGCSYEPGVEIFHWGHAMEPLIAAEFARRTGETVAEPETMISIGQKPHHRASLDRVILENGVPDAALELKNLNESRYAEYRAAGPSIGYLLQLQYQMFVADLPYGYLAVLFGGQRFASWRVVASPSVQREIIRRVDLFWEYVQNKERPPETFGGRGVAKRESNELVLTDPTWETKLLELEDLRLQKTKIEKQEKVLKQQIKETMGDFTKATAGEMQASVSFSTRTSLDTKKLKELEPELCSRFMKEADIKTLRIRKTKGN